MTAQVTIVIPAHNASPTLDETLASVVQQTIPDWRVVAIDDGSTDDTRRMLQGWAQNDDRIHVLHRTHQGVSAARNAGVDAAESRWLLFLDSDDIIVPHYLEVALARATKDTTVDVVHCGLRRMAVDGRLGPDEFAPTDDLFTHLAVYNCFAAPHTCLVTREVVVEANGFDPRFDNSEEWDLWQRIARAGSVFARVDDVLAIYRMRPGSLVRNPGRLMRWGTSVIDRGHGRDTRVRHPAPAYADGVPAEGRDRAVASLLLWAAGLGIGADCGFEELTPWMTKEMGHTVLQMNPSLAANTFIHGGVVGACVLADQWPEVWVSRSDDAIRMINALLGRASRDEWVDRFLGTLSTSHETSTGAVR